MRVFESTSARITRPIVVACAIISLVLATTGCSVLSNEKTADQSVAPAEYTPGVTDSGGGYDVDARESAPVGDEMLVAEAPEDSVTSGTGTDASSIPAEERLIIRNKSLKIEVEAVEDALNEIKALVRSHDAIVTDMQVSTDEEPIYRYDEYSGASTGVLAGYVTVRVPTEKYDSFIDAVAAIGEVKREWENTSDVTQEHVDLTARLENLKAEEARLREFFDKAVDVDDMLSIERELNRVRSEIESMTAQVAYLERQAAMATVTVELAEPQPVVRPAGEDWGFGDAITTGIRGAADVVKIIIVFVIAVLPLALLAALAFFAIRFVLRRRRARRLRASEPMPSAEMPADG